jgi:zinc transport system ATP-binding protein
MAFIFEMDSLSASYGANVVLENVNFRVNESDFIGVIGPNGGGKTTLLKIILGLIKPSAGSITFNRQEISVIRSM